MVFPGGAIILSILMGAWVFILGVSSYQAAASFKDKALSTAGIIIGTRTESGGGSIGGSLPPRYVSTVRFETEKGKIVQFTVDGICQATSFSLHLCNGRKVQVLYASDNPELAMIKRGLSPLDKARSNIGLGIFLILSGVMTFIVAPTEYGGRFGPTQQN
ncbi:MAG: DUF3592 domain-containing protein [Leptolyngbyaceae cyanobacterium SM2_5_2]|nr:DUF3592 domain-containing protein [Leptolyngbyaceae cyanobacterium SM2_5_2]